MFQRVYQSAISSCWTVGMAQKKKWQQDLHNVKCVTRPPRWLAFQFSVIVTQITQKKTVLFSFFN